ncbi:MAG: extracellular solute-binding protein [Chloroflexi bacterium]|nr:extracellular solute-binding protein [Chloroflexota bacterium]
MHTRFFISAFLLALAACTSAAPGEPIESAPTPLIFWHAAREADAETLNALIADFNKTQPTLRVRAEAKSSENELLRQTVAAIALNQPPDFILASSRTLAEFARADALVALDAFIADPGIGLLESERGDFLPGSLDAGRVRDQFVAFPFDTRAVALYYNADLLKAARADAPPRTWDAFSSAARATTKGNAHGWAMSANAFTFYAMLYSRGGNGASETHAQFGDDAGIKTLQMLAALARGGAAYLADNSEIGRSDFAHGNVALWFDTTDHLAAITEAMTRAGAHFQWSIAPVPQNDPSKPVVALLGSSIAIFKTRDERARAAWQCARWLAQAEQIARWARATNSIPTRLSARALLAPHLATNPNLQRLNDGFGNPAPIGRALPSIKHAAQIDLAIAEMWRAVATGADITTALNTATTRVNRLLGQIP